MKLTVAWIGKTKDPAIQDLTDKYLKRLAFYASIEGRSFKDETKLLASGNRSGSAVTPTLIVLDTRGKQLTSEDLAEFLRKHQDSSAHLVFVVGGADGLSEQILQRASFKLSLGKMTISHELARVVLLEQLYRAFTILKGHPYHTGH